MKNVTRIREALAASLETLPLNQVSPWMLSDPTPPALHVIPGPATFDEAMHRGFDTMPFLIQVFVSLSGDIGPQQLLDQMLDGEGATSVKRLVEVDSTLGALVKDCRVTERTGYQQYNAPTGARLMCEWTVIVWE